MNDDQFATIIYSQKLLFLIGYIEKKMFTMHLWSRLPHGITIYPINSNQRFFIEKLFIEN